MNASSTQVGPRGRAAARLLAWTFAAALLPSGVASAGETIENTAWVSFQTPAGSAVRLQSNTVRTEVLPQPHPATLRFMRHEPGTGDAPPTPVDGGLCRTPDGSFVALPPVLGADGEVLDAVEEGTTPGYYTGDAVVIVVADANRNGDPAVREYVDVDIATTTGDAETVRLHETGPDTGMFAGAIPSVPMPPQALHHDCRLSLAGQARITATYVDADYPLDAVTVAAAGYSALPDDRAFLRLDQSVSRQVVEVGDFLQYTLVVRNTETVPAFEVHVTNVLPPGVRYRTGSLRVTVPGVVEASAGASGLLAMGAPAPRAENGSPATLQAQPDGRSLDVPVGHLMPGESASVTFVAEVGAGARGPTLVNRAIARAASSVESNETTTIVALEEPLMTERFTIIGRVTTGSCNLAQATGVQGVRLLLEDGTFVATDGNGAYHFEGVRPGTHVVQLDPLSLPDGLEAVPCRQDTRFAGRGDSRFVEAQGGTLWRVDFQLRPAPDVGGAGGKPVSPGRAEAPGDARRAIRSDAEAAGNGDVDWFEDQAAGIDWIFPRVDYNPRVPSTNVVVKHLPGQTVALRLNGTAVSRLNFEGSAGSGDRSFAISRWHGVDLVDGDNRLEADILDAAGRVVSTLSRIVHYANYPATAVLVPGESILVADGVTRPVVAVRILDRSGKPVRARSSGQFSISPPYTQAISAELQQKRMLAGAAGGNPTWQVVGDDGMAYLDLEPTTTAGSLTLGFRFQGTEQQSAPVDVTVEAWLKSAPRDWIVVGFAKGTVGHDTLADNMQPLQPDDEGEGLRGDGQVSLYAKGRVLGKWMMTLAYDSGKPVDRLRNEGLLSTIDPDQYYTLYGDGTHQGYDAASIGKLYLKLERDQFYALFGDFQTGLDRNELSRYQRTMNGLKVEYRGPLVEFNGFASRTAQHYARDELQGDGTSGLYRLTRGRVLMNSERVRIETRDRYHSERILETRELVRHIDYDIDYAAGTLFFREPVPSRDFDFNPNWILVEYETAGASSEFLAAGGRIGVRLLDDRLQVGATYLRDEDARGASRLAGVDARFALTPSDRLRAEAASTRGEAAPGAEPATGNAWLLEWEHRGERFNLLAYARRQAGSFGLGQQNASESGLFKTGVQGQWQVDEDFSLQGELYRTEDQASGAQRNAAKLETVYADGDWRLRGGLQWVRDRIPGKPVAESRQVTLGANRSFLDDRLDLGLRADFGLGGKNDSVDFPARLQLDAGFRVSESLRLLAAQEFTDGKTHDTSTTRIGFEASPWRDTRFTSTLNQAQVSEYGPRTFALVGLNQRFRLGRRWTLDLSLDSSQVFNETGELPAVVGPEPPILAGGIRDGGALTEEFVALSGGATYRSELWMWNTRLEARRARSSDRNGLTTSVLRQIRDGVALSANLQAFSQDNADGSVGVLAHARLGWAYRPPGSRWSMLDKLEFRLDEVRGGNGEAILGQDTLATVGDARSRRLVNNFVLNYVSDAWAEDDSAGVLSLDQRSQVSIYYGARYVFDTFDGADYAGYTDIIGTEWRFDLGPRIDIGLRASVLHSWRQATYAWAFGPSLGFSPFTNAWVSLGYNVRGFDDRDFGDAHHTAQGPYLVFRMKFDQGTFGLAPEGRGRE